jgi:hypothetical protein
LELIVPSMNLKHLWAWLFIALGLFAFIFFYQRHAQKTVVRPAKILPNLKASAVTRLQVSPAGQAEISAEMTNGAWQLIAPVHYPAETASIENFLAVLEDLTPAASLTLAELKDHPNWEEEFGLAPEQSSIFVMQEDYRAQLKVGKKTAPGDQVFLQVAGKEGVFVVDAELLKYVPAKADDWRDARLVNLNSFLFDRVAVTNGATIFQLQRDGNKLWRLITPNPARANSSRIEELLETLQRSRANRFLPQDPKPDLEALGLQPPEWQLAFGGETNIAALLQFGKSPTNDPHQSYLRLPDHQTIVTVSNDFLAPWRGSVNEFRDSHLLALTAPVEVIEVRGQDSFSLVRQTNDSWRVMPQNFAADTELVNDLLSSLTAMQVKQFVKDMVIEPDLGPKYGLAAPARRYILKSGGTSSPVSSNAVIAELHFGTNQEDKVFARRTDETIVYAVSRAEVERLAGASWQLRERRIWNYNEEDVASATIRKHGKTRQIVHKGQHSWSLAPGSQGSIEDLAVDQTVRDLCRLKAASWIGHGTQKRSECGFSDDGHQVMLELKNGEKLTLEFGEDSPAGLPRAAVCLEEESWIFEYPPSLRRDVVGCLSIPESVP